MKKINWMWFWILLPVGIVSTVIQVYLAITTNVIVRPQLFLQTATIPLGFYIILGIVQFLLILLVIIFRKKMKSYNPFKMWGSGVGAAIGFSIMFLPFLLNLATTILGFLIGWGIHSLIRSLRK